MELTSDPFELVEVDVDRNRGFGNDREQDVDGYAVIILDQDGQEIGTKFQPARIEKDARALMAKSVAKQENPKVRNENVQRQIEERRRRKALRK